ncbi:MAG: GTPase domain-containing protein, partial [Nitrosomonas sp.]|nr:GTPase domain-containing protein [Nitrosomonas sp.]
MGFSDYFRNWPDQWKKLQSLLLQPAVDEDALEASLQAARQQLPPPVLWLLGKTQSGKTSIVRVLTGSDTAQIGNGFQPCTRHSRFYDFPETAPIVRFLDTRGIGEVGYDPAEDIGYCDQQAHLLLVVMKAADIEQQEIVSVVT